MTAMPESHPLREGACEPPGPLRRESGVALILVMVMLLLLSILGMTMLNSTISDLQIATSYKNEGGSFYVADAALEMAQANAIIYSSLLPSVGSVWPPAGEGKLLNDDGSPGTTPNPRYPDYHQITIYKDPLTKRREQGTANIRVTFQGAGAVPAGQGTEVDAGLGGGTGFTANFYLISVIADDRNNSHQEIESSIARVVPK